jgi:hypothetical protein
VIADGAARLIVQSVGTVASMINKDEECGFADMFGVLINPTDVQGEVGEMGSMTWHIDDCQLGASELSVFSEDCLGGVTYLDGVANISSTRTVLGERDTEYFLFDSVVPRNSRSVQLWLEDVELSEFASFGIAAGDSEPLGILTIHQGQLSAYVEPATGERADDAGVFDVATPVASMREVHLRNAVATLESQGKIFVIDIPDTNLSATNGRVDGVTNRISGQVMLDGKSVSIEGPLNPSFSQQSFDQSYACTENLARPLQ